MIDTVNSVKRKLMRSAPFSEMPPQAVLELAESAMVKEYARGSMIFLEGTAAESVFVLSTGVVQLQKTEINGREVIVSTIRKPQLFAEVVLGGDHLKYPVSALCLEKATVVVLPVHSMQRILQSGAVAGVFIRYLIAKQYFLTGKLMYYMCNDVEERLFHYVEEHASGCEHPVLDLSKKDLAAAIGTVPETLSRLLKRLERQKKVKREGRKIIFYAGGLN